jgi:hypothetical protein
MVRSTSVVGGWRLVTGVLRHVGRQRARRSCERWSAPVVSDDAMGPSCTAQDPSAAGTTCRPRPADGDVGSIDDHDGPALDATRATWLGSRHPDR